MDRRTKKKYITWLSGSLGALLILWAGVWYFQNFGFKKYVDQQAGFSIEYPRDWAYSPNREGVKVIFFSPIESDFDVFTENVNIVVQDISSKPMNVEQYSERVVRQIRAVFGDHIEIIESMPTYFANRQGYRMVFQVKGDPQSMRMLMVWTVDGDWAYQLTYTAQPDTYTYYMEDVQKMMDSFRIRK